MTRQEFLEEIRKFPRTERADLALDVLEIVEDDEIELTPGTCAELDRRIAEDDAYTAPAEPVEVVVGRILRGEY
ncbi:MAG TPA: hypothetical protein VF796_13085 [Humisphaera sp.]